MSRATLFDESCACTAAVVCWRWVFFSLCKGKEQRFLFTFEDGSVCVCVCMMESRVSLVAFVFLSPCGPTRVVTFFFLFFEKSVGYFSSSLSSRRSFGFLSPDRRFLNPDVCSINPYQDQQMSPSQYEREGFKKPPAASPDVYIKPAYLPTMSLKQQPVTRAGFMNTGHTWKKRDRGHKRVHCASLFDQTMGSG